jgi:colanic acid/amylovoran biosynthesis glycosyltransferase
MAPLRLGYFVPQFPAQTHAFFWREARALEEMGHHIEFLSSRRPPDTASRHAFAAKARERTYYTYPPNVEGLRWMASHPSKVARCVRYLSELRGASVRERVEHAGLLACAARLAAFAKAKALQHIHLHSCANSAHLLALTYLLGGPSYSLTLHGNLEVYGTDHDLKTRHATFVSPVTRLLKAELMERLGLSDARTPVILMGVDTDRFVDVGKRDPRQGHLHLVTVARLNPNKGHRFALRAMRKAMEEGCSIRYTVAGGDEANTRESLEREIRELGLEDHVELPGTIGEEEVLDLLQRADGFVLPSIHLGEASPVSVMEAMACSLPVVSSIIGGTPDMIEDGVDGLLVAQKDVDGLAAAFLKLANDLPLRARLGEAARPRAERQFDYRSNARKLAEAITAHLPRDGTREASAAALRRATEPR